MNIMLFWDMSKPHPILDIQKYPCKEVIKRVYSEGRTEEEAESGKKMKKDVDRGCGKMIYSSSTVRKGSEEVL